MNGQQVVSTSTCDWTTGGAWKDLELGGRALLEVLGPVPAELVRLLLRGADLLVANYIIEVFGFLVAT